MIKKENMHIDELVQSRLANASDNEGIHQAWDKMQAMLDKDKERPAGALWKSSWLLPALLVTIISGAGIGYWQLSSHDENPTLAFNNTASPQINNPNTASTTVTEDINDKDRKDEAAAMPNTVAANKPVNTQKGVHSNGKNFNNRTSNKSQKNNTTPTDKNKFQPVNTSSFVKNKNTNPADADITIEKHTGTRIAISNDGRATLISDNPNVNAGLNTASATQTPKSTRYNAREIKQAQNRMIAEAEAGNLFIDPANDNLISKRATVNQKTFTVIEKSKTANGKTVTYTETIDHGYQPIVKYIPLEPIEVAALQQGLHVYVADMTAMMQPIAIATYSDAPSNDVVVSSSKNITGKGSKIGKSGGTDALLKDLNQFFEIRKKFYTNVFGGFNTSAANAFPFGFQVGVGLHYWIGGNWSVGTEGGYVFRPMNHTFIDEAATYTQIGAGVPVPGGTRFNYKEQKVANHYNFSYVQAFEIPLLFTYHKEQWSMYAGPSLSLGMPMRYQKTELASSEDKVIIQNSIAEFLDMPSTQLRSTPDDFKTNLGLGAVLGVNYHFNSNFAISFRYSQVLKDNALTNVGQELSSKMFRSPSFRLGILYKIGKDKNVQFLMDSKYK